MIISENTDPDFPTVWPNVYHVIIGTCFFVLLILSLWVLPQVVLGYSLLSAPILIFDAIFIFLIFPLPGPLLNKMLLAGTGNIIGLAWGYLLDYLAANTCHYFGGAFSILYFAISPFLQLLWITFMWALGLSVLAATGCKKEGIPP